MQGTLCCTSRISYDRLLLQKESQILAHFDRPGNLQVVEVPIVIYDPRSNNRINSTMHTLIIKNKDPNAKSITFFHGFGCPCASYMSFLEKMAEQCTVYAVDHLGMGCSGKPDIDYGRLDAHQIIDLFVDSYEQWRIGIGIDKLFFACHSLGGYFALVYSIRYATHVEGVITFSTPMLTDFPPGFNEENRILTFKQKFIYSFWRFMNKRWLKGFTCFSLLPMKMFLRFWMEGRNCYSPDLKELMVDYLALQFWDRGFSGDIVPELMKCRAYTHYLPVITILQQLKNTGIKLCFVFGEKDWIDFPEFIKEEKKMGLGINIRILTGCTHQIPLMNHEECAKIVSSILE